MANALALKGKRPVRMLAVGYPGSGKTGMIASLLEAGYKVRMIDLEGNIDPLLEFASDEALSRLDVVTVQDRLAPAIGGDGIEVPGVPTAFNKAVGLLKEWKYKDDDGNEVNLGKSSEWGSDTVVVIDSLTALGEAALIRATKMMNKTPKNRTSAVWGAAVDDLRNVIQLASRDSNAYHLIILGHLRMLGPEDFLKQGDDDEVEKQKLKAIADDLIPTRLYPRAVTKNQSMEVHKDLPTMVRLEKVSKVGREARVIKTVSGAEIDLKVPSKNVKSEYPIETGLAQLFRDMGVEPPSGKATGSN